MPSELVPAQGGSVSDGMAAFATARLDEEEARAEAMEHFTVFEQPYYSCAGSRTEPYGDLEWGEERCDCGVAGRKAKRLREIAAMRAILGMYVATLALVEAPPPVREGPYAGKISARDYLDAKRELAVLRPAVAELAGIWADHADYEDWKP